jgi:hypothetical protein
MSFIVLLTLYLLNTAATLEPGYPFHDDILEKCACSPDALKTTMLAWRGFNQEAEIFDAGCHPYQNGSEATMGIESGQVWIHPASKVETKSFRWYWVTGLSQLMDGLNGSFGGTFSFGVTTSDDGSSRSKPPTYGVHASLPTKQARVSVILPMFPEYQNNAFLDKLLTSLVFRDNLPFSKKQAQAYWRGRPAGAKKYRKVLLEKLSKLPNTSLSFQKVPIANFFRHQMILALDGHSFSSVFKEALLTESVVIRLRKENKNNRVHQEWFEPMLQNFHHFIAVDDTPQAVNKTIAWVLANQKEASLIGLRGSAFGRKIFSRPFTFCYSCVTLHLAAAHQKISSTCPPNTSFRKMGWQLLNMDSSLPKNSRRWFSRIRKGWIQSR